jgi:hypothetical protein
MQDLIEALTILNKYYGGDKGICAAHDIIYSLVDHKDTSPEDYKRLTELGWFHTDSDNPGNWSSFT